MSSRPWKLTNSRSNTNNTDIIHCDELFVDDLLANNATLRNVTINKEVTTNTFDVSNISITDNINVPDVSVNNIGKYHTNDNSYIAFVSPFSAPFGLIDKIRANDTSFTTLKVNDVSLNRISNINNDAVVVNSDVSFNAAVSANTSLFSDIYSDTELRVHSDVSSNATISVHTISLERLSHINSGGIIEIKDDISANKIYINSDLSVNNVLDASTLVLDVIDNLYGGNINFLNDTIIDGSGSIRDLSVNTMEGGITFTSNVNALKNVMVGGDISINTLEMSGRFVNDVSFIGVTANDVSVNRFGLKNAANNTIIIDSDISINNSEVLTNQFEPIMN